MSLLFSRQLSSLKIIRYRWVFFSTYYVSQSPTVKSFGVASASHKGRARAAFLLSLLTASSFPLLDPFTPSRETSAFSDPFAISASADCLFISRFNGTPWVSITPLVRTSYFSTKYRKIYLFHHMINQQFWFPILLHSHWLAYIFFYLFFSQCTFPALSIYLSIPSISWCYQKWQGDRNIVKYEIVCVTHPSILEGGRRSTVEI